MKTLHNHLTLESPVINHGKLQSIGLKGLQFCDGLRWHHEKLWFSDLLGRRIYFFDHSQDELTQVAYIGGQPSGLGHFTNGSLIAASMMDRLILHWPDGKPAIYQDLSSLCSSPLNDLLVDNHNRIYVGSFGFQAAYEGPENAKPSSLYLIDTDKNVSVVADDLFFPNGMVITHSGRQLIVAETFANRLTSFDIDTDGGLSNRTLFCDLGERSPDGLCVDKNNTLWVGCPFSEEFLKVSVTGEVIEVIKTEGGWAVSPVIGGPGNDLLFLATANTTLEQYHSGISQSDIAVLRLPIMDEGGDSDE